jgi:hypothetical protein
MDVERDFLVFWCDFENGNRATVVRLSEPPHDPAKGSILHEMLSDALSQDYGAGPVIHGAVELPNANWSPGAFKDVIVGQQHVQLECSSGAWRTY